MEIANKELRQILKDNKIYQWQVAQKLGMQDSNFSKLLRQELTVEKKKEVIDAINNILNRR